jgi:uncharacterized protein (TIGR00297 family)
MAHAPDIGVNVPTVRVWTLRRVLHLSFVVPAFLLFTINWYQTAGLALLLLVLELVVLDGLGIDLSKVSGWRKQMREQSSRAGIVLCPVALLILALIFYGHLAAVAAAWGGMAIGDVMAGIAGQQWGRRRLPFNEDKSWAGFFSFIGFGALGVFALLMWTSPWMPITKTLEIAVAGGLVGALVESLPIRLDDNITVPVVSAGFIFCALLIARASFDSNLPYLGVRVILAVGINAAFAFLAWRLRQVSRSGAVVGFCLGVAVYMGFGYKSFLVLMAFIVLGSIATRLGYSAKMARGIAEARRGARSWREALGNILPAAWFSILVITSPYQAAFLMAMTAAFAEAAGDTVASETGKWLSAKAWLITSLKAVPAGENGGISVAGTLLGIAASALITAVAYAMNLIKGWEGAFVLVAAIAGNFLDSLIGATLERNRLVSNSIVNFAGTGFAGALALVFGLHHW